MGLIDRLPGAERAPRAPYPAVIQRALDDTNYLHWQDTVSLCATDLQAARTHALTARQALQEAEAQYEAREADAIHSGFAEGPNEAARKASLHRYLRETLEFRQRALARHNHQQAQAALEAAELAYVTAYRCLRGASALLTALGGAS